jgi:nucleoside-diphosphate-sugar epimerase
LDELKLNAIKAIGNLEDPKFVDEIMEGVDTVVNIAGIKYSEAIIDAAIRNHVKRAILVHTTGRFSRFKSAAEGYCRIENGILAKTSQISMTILRPTMIYGSSMDRNMYKLVDYLYRHRLFPVFGNGRNLMQPVHARDLGDAYYKVLVNHDTTINKSYDLSGKAPIAYVDLVRTVSNALGRTNVLVRIPMWLSLVAADIYNRATDNALISVEQVLRMSEDKVFDHGAATRDFGYDPVSFEEGIAEEVKEYLHSRRSRSHPS